MTVLVALLVCLIPTTIGGLLSAIGVAGMSRMMQANVIATSAARWKRRATSTCCCSTRPARSRSAIARRRHSCRRRASPRKQLADAAQLSSLADETPEGRSIVVLAKQRFNIRERDMRRVAGDLPGLYRADAHERRRSAGDREIRKGAAEAVKHYVEAQAARFRSEGHSAVDGSRAARQHAAGGRRQARRRACWA